MMPSAALNPAFSKIHIRIRVAACVLRVEKDKVMRSFHKNIATAGRFLSLFTSPWASSPIRPSAHRLSLSAIWLLSFKSVKALGSAADWRLFFLPSGDSSSTVPCSTSYQQAQLGATIDGVGCMTNATAQC